MEGINPNDVRDILEQQAKKDIAPLVTNDLLEEVLDRLDGIQQSLTQIVQVLDAGRE